MSDFLMGFDIGGHSVRCLLVEPESGLTVTAVRPWEPVRAPGAFAFELDMDLCWRLLAETSREALARARVDPFRVRAIAATGMRFGMVVVGLDGRVLLAVPNRDARAAGEGSDLAAEHGELFNARTGHWPLPIFAGVRLRWLAASNPDIFAQAGSALGLSDWVGLRLTGVTATTPTHAGETLAFDLERREWAWDLVDLLELPRGLFPAALEAGVPLGHLTADAAAVLGLEPDIPVVMGGADTQCGLLGAGAVTPGQMGVIVGSTTPLQLVTARPCVDGRARVWAGHHLVPGAWVLESNAGDTGEALLWLAEVLYPGSDDPVGRFFAEARRSAPGSGAALSSFGASVMNAREMSLPIGSLALTHMGRAADPAIRRSGLDLAVLEGMAFAVKANAEQLLSVAAAGLPDWSADLVDIRLAGGMTRSPLWTGMVCDSLDRPVSVSQTPDASALGAAICAGVGAGIFADLSGGAHALARVCPLTPDLDRVRLYAGLYADWQSFRITGAASDEIAAGIALQQILDRPAPVEQRGAPAPKLRILATADLDRGTLDDLRRLGELTHMSYREELRVLSGEDLVEELRGYDILITEADVVDVEALWDLPDLRVVAACRGQAVNVDVDACTALGIPVLFAPGRNADAVAELAVAFMLALSRRLVAADSFLRAPDGEAGDMGRQGQAHAEFHGHELWGRTVGLVGLGAVGQAVARRLRAFGARILVYDPYAEPDDVRLLEAEPVALDALLEQSDLVSLHAPVTDETRGLIGERELARMKPGAYLVNTARAALVDEAALADALRAGHLGGAALDVFALEPPGADHPLLALPNVIATPHIAGNTVEVAAHQGRMIAEDLGRLAAGRPPLHVLNPDVLAGFSWEAPRPALDGSALEALADGPGPSVSDLQTPGGPPSAAGVVSTAAVGMAGGTVDATAGSEVVVGVTAPADADPVAVQVERVVRLFVGRAVSDPALGAFAAKRDIITHYVYSDLGLEFYIGFHQGRTTGGLGPPSRPAEVRMKAKAETFDGILTGKISGHRAAMSGKLSFNGDVRLAMGVQKIQRDLIRLYSGCREEAGGIDFAARPAMGVAAPAMAASGARPSPIRTEPIPDPGGLREEIAHIAEELFAAQLLTPTGGNISARVPGSDAALITPSQLFKGALRPETLVQIDLDGNPLDPEGTTPSSERLLHTEIYRARPDVAAIIHAHAPYATILVLSGIPFVPVTTEAAFVGDIPRVPFIMPGSRELASAVTRALDTGTAALLQNHGLIVVGGDLRQAANTVEVVERASQLIWGCHVAGKRPATLPKDVVAALRDIGQATA